MKLCVFQGSFNPIHNAHIGLAKYVLENYEFDKFLFIPAFVSPHKKIEHDNSRHRFNMIKLATKNLCNIEVSGIEISSQAVSYTYPTILELYKSYQPEDKISFIIGTDAFEKIETWHKSKELKELLSFLVFEREYNFDYAKLSHLTKKGYDYRIIDKSFEDISSTQIRKMIKNDENPKGLIDEQVWGYIKRHELYKL